MSTSTSTFAHQLKLDYSDLSSDSDTSSDSDDDRSNYSKIIELITKAKSIVRMEEFKKFVRKLQSLLVSTDLETAKLLIDATPFLLDLLGKYEVRIMDHTASEVRNVFNHHSIPIWLVNSFSGQVSKAICCTQGVSKIISEDKILTPNFEEYKELVGTVYEKYPPHDSFLIIKESFSSPRPIRWFTFKHCLSYLQIQYQFSDGMVFNVISDYLWANVETASGPFRISVDNILEAFDYAAKVQPYPGALVEVIRYYIHDVKFSLLIPSLEEKYLVDLCEALSKEVLTSNRTERQKHFSISCLESLYPKMNADILSSILAKQVSFLKNFLTVESPELGAEVNAQDLILRQGAFVRWVASIECNLPNANLLAASTRARLLEVLTLPLDLYRPSSVKYRMCSVSLHIPTLRLKQESFCNFEADPPFGFYRVNPFTPLQAFIFSNPDAWRILLIFASPNPRDNKNPLKKLPLVTLYMILSFHDPLYLLCMKEMQNLLLHVRNSRREGFCFFDGVRVEAPQKRLCLGGDPGLFSLNGI